MNIVDEYMLQRFPQVKGEQKGKLETDTQYKARICWYRHGYPTSEKLEKLCGTKKGTIDNYRYLFDWKGIKEHAANLQVKQDQIDLKERQKNVENKHRERNDKLGQAYEDYLNELLDELNDNLSITEKESIIKKLQVLRDELSKIQRDERTTEHLPNSYKDITNEINLNGDIDANVKQEVQVNRMELVKQKRKELNDLRRSNRSN